MCEAVGDEGGAVVGGELEDGDVEVGELDGVAEVQGLVRAAEDGVQGGEVAVGRADEQGMGVWAGEFDGRKVCAEIAHALG